MKLPVELQAGESVVLRVRRHPIYMLLKVTGALLVAAVPSALLLWLGLGLAAWTGIGAIVVIAVAAVWALFWAFRAYMVWYRHNHDEWIVTNQRLIDFFKPNWFNQRSSSADLVNVQDITVQKNGLFSTMFNFGDVRCQTAGADATFILSGIPDPARVLAVVDQSRDAARSEVHQGGRRENLRDLAPDRPRDATVADRIPPGTG